MTAIGPFDRQSQARDLPAVQEIHAAMRSGRSGAMTAANYQMLLDALTDAGIEPGAYELDILRWLANWEPTTCAVIVALLSRANQP